MNFIKELKRNPEFRKKETSLLYEMIKKGTAYTHAGIFHADDVACAALLKIINPDIHIKRVYDASEIPEGYLAFDIGLGKYDHHQMDNEYRAYLKRKGQFMPYASFGKLWEVLGPEIVGIDYYEIFDREIVSNFDYADNTGYQNTMTYFIAAMNPNWNEEQSEEESNRKFDKAVEQLIPYFKDYFKRILAIKEAETLFPQIVDRAKELKIGENTIYVCIEEKFVPISKQLAMTTISFYVYPTKRGGYGITPIKLYNSNDYKISFPINVLGKPENELRKIIPGLSFVHSGGFFAVADNVESAISFIKYCVENQEDIEEMICF